ncbi:hypothetical protein P4O66_019722 [Electrophorus voltai]|uniref:FHA domain-containing protein n=1 Tax=Electrophorus voltai TaxID=2609070 RepID=A0AAD8ZU64_9TELE|nr:hypothetical protein P4O66_019722 [Electrophorus voltai]
MKSNQRYVAKSPTVTECSCGCFLAEKMLSGVQPCFQLLRIGSSNNANGQGSDVADLARDLYTFRPALAQSVFRLGRAVELCDVTLESSTVSRIHAELHAERQTDGVAGEGWKVQVKDRSSYGTWVNDVRIQQGVLWEIFDGDTLTFGGQSVRGNPEFYFLFQKVRVRPQDFDAITVPKASSFSSDIQNRIRTSLDSKPEPSLDLSKLSINRATVILNSIGSLSKMNGSCWTFKRTDKTTDLTSTRTPSFTALVPPSTPPPLPAISKETSSKSLPPSSKSRRKSAHTVLLEDDSSDDPVGRRSGLEGARKVRGGKRRRLYKSESEMFQPPLSKTELSMKSQFDIRPVIPKQNGIIYNYSTNGKPANASLTSLQKRDIVNMSYNKGINLVSCRQQKPCLPAPRGRRRTNSSPVYSPLVVGGVNYHLASPSMRLTKVERERGQVARFKTTTGRQRGRPRKHPLPRASLPSPSSSSSSTSSSSSSSSSSSDEDDEDEDVGAQGVEPCAAVHCRLPQQDTVQWVQCDDCDAWYHLDCLPHDWNQASFLVDPSADFHCGCC